MHTKRIIPCLDVNNGRVVKGTNFINLRDAGDPIEVGMAYDKAGADELVFLDITASSDAREIKAELVRKVAETIFIPFTVGGGIRSVEDFKMILREGADKVAVNSAAIMNPTLISEAAEKFGSQCVVVAIDAKRRLDGGWNIFKNGAISTTLTVKVWSGDEEITDLFDDNDFRWTRVSDDAQSDSAWNAAHFGGAKQIVITQNDVWRRATFFCELKD